MENENKVLSHRVSHYTLAQLTQAAYHEGGGNPPTDWEIYDAAYPNGNQGVGIATYINHKTKSIVIAIRGTDFARKDDVWTDFRLALGGIPNGTVTAYKQAENAKEWMEQQQEKDKKAKEINENPPSFTIKGKNQNKVDHVFIGTSISSSLTQKSFIWKVLLELLLPGMLLYSLSSYAVYEGLKKEIETLTAGGLQLEKEQEETIVKAMHQLEKKFSKYEIIVTGHSLGATIAELTASVSNLPAVTFDSPGSKLLLAQQHHYNQNFVKKNFTYYLAGPNIVNTLYEHIGTGYRLYIPHSKPGTMNSLKFFGDCALGSVKRITGIATIGIAAFSSGGLAVPAVVTGASAVVGGLSGLIGDVQYLHTQHALSNIIDCFDANTGLPTRKASIVSWPYRGATGVVTSAVKESLKGWIPFKWANKGLHSWVFSDEDQIVEAQIEEMSGYQVNKL